MSKTLARINAELKALSFCQEKFDMDLNEFTQIEQISFIKNADSRVITQEEKAIMEAHRN